MSLNLFARNRLSQLLKDHCSDSFFGYDGDEQVYMRCPFCGGGDTRKESFSVNFESGLFRCFREESCGIRGNYITLYAKLYNVSNGEAYNVMNGMDGVSKEEMLDSLRFIRGKIEKFRSPYRTSFSEEYPYIEPLFESEFLPVLRQWIEWRGYSFDSFMLKHDLFIPNQDGPHRGRVGFNIYTEGNSCYLLYRVGDDESLGKKTLNSPGNFHSRCLYNYDNVQDHPEWLFVTEGIFDCARLLSWGLDAVALFGTNLSEYQAFLLEQANPKNLVFCLDGGTEKAMETNMSVFYDVVEQDMNVFRMELSGDEDPDSITQTQFLTYLAKAIGETND